MLAPVRADKSHFGVAGSLKGRAGVMLRQIANAPAISISPPVSVKCNPAGEEAYRGRYGRSGSYPSSTWECLQKRRPHGGMASRSPYLEFRFTTDASERTGLFHDYRKAVPEAESDSLTDVLRKVYEPVPNSLELR